MKMKDRCIIYGGAGFIGSHITDDLLSHGVKVTIFDKLYASKSNVSHVLNEIEFIEGDFNNKQDIHDSLKGKNFVIHLVSSTIPADSNLNPQYDTETNLISTLNLLDECSLMKIKRIVFISSGGTIYGTPVKIPINEDHPTNPSCSYGIIKLAIEKYLGLYKTLKGLDYRVLRLSNPFGERQNPGIGQGLIVTLLHRIKNSQTVEIWGDGNVVRDYFYIKDGAKSAYLAMKDKSNYNFFNISSGKGISINGILEKFRKVLKLNFKVRYTAKRKFDVPVNILDNRRALKYLGWKPETSIDEALNKTWSYINGNK
jgi:UDP-glucose 4-epimerase